MIRNSFKRITLHGFQTDIETVIELRKLENNNTSLILCLVDNDETRYFVSEHLRQYPQIHCGITENAEQGFVFIQTPHSKTFTDHKPPRKIIDESASATTYAQAVWPQHVITGLVTYAGNMILQDKDPPWTSLYFNFGRNPFVRSDRWGSSYPTVTGYEHQMDRVKDVEDED